MNDDGGANFLTFPWLPGVSQDNYHAIAHRTSSGTPTPTRRQSMRGFTSSMRRLARTARLGRRGLGHGARQYVCLITTDMQDGQSHLVQSLPWTMVGSCGGFFKTGQVVECNNAPNNQLLTSILHAMGKRRSPASVTRSTPATWIVFSRLSSQGERIIRHVILSAAKDPRRVAG